jgi:zinc protease
MTLIIKGIVMFLTATRRAYGGLLLVLLLAGCGDIHETTLANGLRVVVKEDHRAPVVVSMVWYKIGSVDEPEGLTGISHALEHMMFKGTERLKPNEFSRIIAAHGGRENAFTGYDATGYYQQLEKSRLPIAFELEADRMQNLRLDESEFKKEIQVVMEERRLRTDDRPESLVYENFMATAYRVHPYRQPVIGWMKDLERLTVDDLRDWYRRFYSPSNATVVVVGDVEPDAVFDLAKKYFGPVPARAVDRPTLPAEPPQNDARRIQVRVPAQVPYLLMGFHTPILRAKGAAAAHEPWEPYALLMLAGVLDGGASARFETDLVRARKIAASIGTEYRAIARSPAMMLFSGTPATGHTTADLERAVKAHLERVQREPVPPAELARIKAQVIANEVYERDSMFSTAYQLGELAMAGLDLDLIDQRVARLNAVTPEQITAVARKYFAEHRLTVAELDPLPIGPRFQPARPTAGVTHGR